MIGASGYLGTEVAARAGSEGREVVGTSTTGSGGWLPLDITDRSAVRALVARVRPQVVINTAYRNDSWVVCADGAASVAIAAAECGARLVHLSTDAVHGGRPAPYRDDEPPTPVNHYGSAKAAAETAVAAVHPGAVLIRTSLIIGDRRSKQIRMCIDMINGDRPGVLYADEVRCPVAVDDLAAAVLELAGTDVPGTINVAGPDAVTRAEMGELVAARYGLDPARVPIGRVTGSGLARAAEVRLDSSYAAGLLTTRLRGAREVIAAAGDV